MNTSHSAKNLQNWEEAERENRKLDELDRARFAMELMAGESRVMGNAAGDGWVDMVTNWLGPQLAAAVRLQLLNVTDEAERVEILRGLMADWNRLRRREQTAERIEIERRRVELVEQVQWERKKTEMDQGLDALLTVVKERPKAFAALKELAVHLPRRTGDDVSAEERVREKWDAEVFDPEI